MKDGVFSVSELNEAAREKLESGLGLIRVEGEISGYIAHSSGHHYFELKDANARLKCALFAGNARKVKIRLKDGIQVICTGNVTIYPKYGQYQLVVVGVDAGGLGLLYQKLEALKKKLQDEGLLDEKRKKPLPPFPRRVGVVTSPVGQAIHDILKILRKRAPQIEVRIYPVKVQGPGAAEEIAEGLRYLDREGLCDILVAGRGGGSIEDLWAFNEEVVARAIAACRTPVISAVGHEKDILLSDLVADLRAPTPSGAAEMLAVSREEIRGTLARLRAEMARRFGERISNARGRLANLSRHDVFRRTGTRLYERIQDVGEFRSSVIQSMRRRLDGIRSRLGSIRLSLQQHSPAAELRSRRERLAGYRAQMRLLAGRNVEERRQRAGMVRRALADRLPAARLADGIQRNRLALERLRALTEASVAGRREKASSLHSLLLALSPERLLERGFSICYLQDGTTVLTDSEKVSVSGQIVVRLHRGRLHARVTSSETFTHSS